MRTSSKNRIREWLTAIAVCVGFFVLVVAGMWIKLQAYNGDPDCLFVKCVKVIK